MHAFLTPLAGVWNAPARRARIAKWAFVVTVLYAGAMFWFAQYPPMQGQNK